MSSASSTDLIASGPLHMVRAHLTRLGLTVNIWDEQPRHTLVQAFHGLPRGEFGRICLHGSVQRIGNWIKETPCNSPSRT